MHDNSSSTFNAGVGDERLHSSACGKCPSMSTSREDIAVETVWEERIGFIGGLELDDDDDDDFDLLDNLSPMFGVSTSSRGFTDPEREEP